MDLDGRRESTNVEDRRGMSGGAKAGLGGGIMGNIIALIAMFMGGGGLDLGSILGQMGNMGGIEMQQGTDNNGEPVEFSAEEQELASFSKKILGGTEDIWSQIFEQQGLGEYRDPKMVLYSGMTSTACGQGQAAMGPFYCSGDQSLYLDLSFFMSMKQQSRWATMLSISLACCSRFTARWLAMDRVVHRPTRRVCALSC